MEQQHQQHSQAVLRRHVSTGLPSIPSHFSRTISHLSLALLQLQKKLQEELLELLH
jgi:hypothetical protein